MQQGNGRTLKSRRQQLAAPPLYRRGIGQLLIGTNPAAGANYTRQVPGDYWERILSLAFTLTTSATAAARTLAMNFLDGDGHIWNQTAIAFGVTQSNTYAAYGDLAQVSPIAGGTGLSSEGSVTSPGATATITSVALPAGTYQVSAVVNLAGTVTQGTDNNNIKLNNGGLTLYANLDNTIAAGEQYFGPYEIEIPSSGGSVLAQTIGAATTGAIYSVSLTATPTVYQTSFQFPDFVLQPGWQVQIAVGNIQAADQLSGIYLNLERYSSDYANGGYELEQDERIQRELAEYQRGNWG